MRTGVQRVTERLGSGVHLGRDRPLAKRRTQTLHLAEQQLRRRCRFGTRTLSRIAQLLRRALAQLDCLLQRLLRASLEPLRNALCFPSRIACRCRGGERGVQGKPLIASPRLPRSEQGRWQAESFCDRERL